MSKLLLSFLGTSDYKACNYYYGDKKVENVRFIQEAIVKIFCNEWSKEDKIIIFLTQEAKQRNWDTGFYKDKNENSYEGLPNRLKDLPITVESCDIPEGKNLDEIWQIFDIVFKSISENDEIIFDITHSFRSIPMIVLIILNYAKFVKNITIKGVYYGAFEVLGSPSKVENIPIEERNAPIFDMTGFISLLDWTNAISNFLKYGDAGDINKLSKQELKPILSETQGKNLGAKNMKQLAEKLETLTQDVVTVRSKKLYSYNFNQLHDLVQKNKDCFIKPMIPLMDKIEQKITDFKNNDIKNGYVAVKWCIEHNLIQQGYTFLLETIVSDILLRTLGEEYLINTEKRELVNMALNIKFNKREENDWKEKAKQNKEDIYKILYSEIITEEFAKKFEELSQTRNDINHAGLRQNSTDYNTLKDKLESYYNYFKDYFFRLSECVA